MPGTLKMEELNAQVLKISDSGKHCLECRGFTATDVKEIMSKGRVNYSESKVHERPYPIFAVDGRSKDGRLFRILIADIADTSKILTIADLQQKKDTCCSP